MSGTLKVGGKTLATHDTNTNVAKIQLGSTSDVVLTDSAGNNVLSESGGVVTLTADEANVGSNALVVDANGNLGIGTDSPNSLLNNRNGLVQLKASGSNGCSYSLIDDTGSNEFVMSLDSADDFVIQNNAATDVYFYLNGSERMRIDSSGKVGIGTDSPNSLLSNRNGLVQLKASGSNGCSYSLIDNTGTKEFVIALASDDSLYIQNNDATDVVFYLNSSERMRIDSSGALILAGSTAQKATGTTWSNPSDQRLKSNISDYPKGTAELMQVRVREWEYNGKGGTVAGTKGLGVIADEIMTVLPNTVDNYEAKLNVDDEETTQIKKFDATEITWLTVKTIQEQQALIESQQSQIDALTARIEALEATP